MTGNKDENIQGVAGEGSKPVSIMNVKLYSGKDANILHFIDYDFYDRQPDPLSQMAYFHTLDQKAHSKKIKYNSTH